MLSDLEPEADLTVQAVLVDTSIASVAEEEEEEERKPTEAEPASPVEQGASPLAAPLPNAGIHTEPGRSEDGPVAAVLVMATEPSDNADPQEEEEEPTVIDREEAGPPGGSEPMGCAPGVAPILDEQAEEEEPDAVNHPDQKPIITEEATGAGGVQEVAEHPTNGMSPEEHGIEAVEQNGTERSLSPSETDLSPCALRHDGTEDDIITERTENGEEDSPDRKVCVRALYDYQAEDESELSLELGDIISVVETVDNAWWRGCSKDGRQGLFPANYVETI